MDSSTHKTRHRTRRVDGTLSRFFRREAPVEPGESILVAFSGGRDSMALLARLARVASRLRVRVVAAHLDHGLDPGSADRAATALRLARSLGVTCRVGFRSVPDLRRPGESLEAAARRVRYRYLLEVGREVGARWVATAHHRDDQVETVLLRLVFGSGWEGLSAIQPVWRPAGLEGMSEAAPAAIVRPLLELPREALVRDLRAQGLAWVEDPTNQDLSRPRNLVRHRVLPRLETRWPGLGERLARLAERARCARRRVTARLARELELEPGSGPVLASVAWRALRRLPPELLPIALGVLHRAAGASHPASRRVRRELVRQLAGGADPGRVAGVDCGGGLRWQLLGDRLAVTRADPEPPPVRFTYTLEAPGELVVEELGIGVRLLQVPVAPWMWGGSPTRAALELALEAGDRVEIRNRRPGDRIWPLGSPGSRRLKEVLIDRRVPRDRRDRLPLLIVGSHIAWVPGVTIDHRFRLRGVGGSDAGPDAERGQIVWMAEIFRP